MNDVVLDASALIAALLGKDDGAIALRARLRGTRCHAPHLIDAEVGNVLRKSVQRGELTPAQALEAFDLTQDVVDVRYPHGGALGHDAWAWRDNLSFYDALYVSLATRLAIPLLTQDRKLAAPPGLQCEVEVI